MYTTLLWSSPLDPGLSASTAGLAACFLEGMASTTRVRSDLSGFCFKTNRMLRNYESRKTKKQVRQAWVVAFGDASEFSEYPGLQTREGGRAAQA